MARVFLFVALRCVATDLMSFRMEKFTTKMADDGNVGRPIKVAEHRRRNKKGRATKKKKKRSGKENEEEKNGARR